MERATGRTLPRGTAWRFAPAVLLVVLIVVSYAMGGHRYVGLQFLAESGEALKEAVEARPLAAPLAFFLFYVCAVALSFPATVLSIFAGYLFGFLQGALLVVLAATTGASLLFLSARYVFGDFLRRLLGGRAERLATGFERDAFAYLLVLRLTPVLPFFLVNVAPGFFRVRFATFLAATLLGILPGTFTQAWLGHGLDSVLEEAREAGQDLAPFDLLTWEMVLAFVLLALVALLSAVVRSVWNRRRG